MFVSVIVPVFNDELYLEECINSILAQTYNSFELILVNDGSIDSSPIICDRFCELDNRIRVIHKENGGLVSAWKKGLEESTSEFVVFVDSDDYISERYLEKLICAQEESDVDIVVSTMTTTYVNRQVIVKNFIDTGVYDRNAIENKILPILLNAGDFEKRGILLSRCAKLIRKKIMMVNKSYVNNDVTFSEDTNIMLPVIADANKLVCLDDDECQYYYRYGGDTMLHGYNSTMKNSIELVHEALLKVVKDKKLPVLEKQVYANYLAAGVQYYKNELLNPDGLKAAIKNIQLFTSDQMFCISIDTTDWAHYRKLNVLIIKNMRNYRGMIAYGITAVLMFLKRIRMLWLERK